MACDDRAIVAGPIVVRVRRVRSPALQTAVVWSAFFTIIGPWPSVSIDRVDHCALWPYEQQRFTCVGQSIAKW